MPVSYPKFGPREVRGLRFDSEIPTLMKPGRTTTISGVVTAADIDEYNTVVLGYNKFLYTNRQGLLDYRSRLSASVFVPKRNGNNYDLRVTAPIAADGTFSAEVRFEAGSKGRYVWEVWLQEIRGGRIRRYKKLSSLSPIYVEK